MIDIENMIYAKVKNGLKVALSYDVFTESTFVTTVSSFPCVSIVETDNAVYGRTQDLTSRENHAQLTYEIDVYTEGDDKKSQAKEIANAADEIMLSLGFTRTMRSQVPNVERTVYRITMRYTGVSDAGIEADGVKIYHIYRG